MNQFSKWLVVFALVGLVGCSKDEAPVTVPLKSIEGKWTSKCLSRGTTVNPTYSAKAEFPTVPQGNGRLLFTLFSDGDCKQAYNTQIFEFTYKVVPNQGRSPLDL